MTSFTCALAWLCAVLMIPLMLFIWALDTKKTRIKRYRKYGWSWKKIAGIYGVSPTTARGGLLLSNESKNQTKVDQLIHPIRTKIFYSIYLE